MAMCTAPWKQVVSLAGGGHPDLGVTVRGHHEVVPRLQGLSGHQLVCGGGLLGL